MKSGINQKIFEKSNNGFLERIVYIWWDHFWGEFFTKMNATKQSNHMTTKYNLLTVSFGQ